MILSTSTNIVAFRSDGGKNPFEYSIEQCAKAGYKVLDLNFCEAMNPFSRLRGDDWETYIKDIEKMGKDWGVTFAQSHLPYYDIWGDNSPEKVELMEELIRRSIIASGMLGIKWTVTHPGTVYSAGQNMQISHDRNVEYYSKHVECAKEAGIGIALENDFEYKSKPYQRIFCSTISELTTLCDAFNSSNVGICYDFGHAHLTGGFHRQNLNAIGSRLKAVHVADNHGERDEHLMPFYGTIDWEECMAGLADIDYQGELTYEIQEFGRHLPQELKHTVVEHSIEIGNYLISLYDNAMQEKLGK